MGGILSKQLIDRKLVNFNINTTVNVSKNLFVIVFNPVNVLNTIGRVYYFYY